jgi:hypothetical protein
VKGKIMRKTCCLLALPLAFTTLALADSFSGKLVDATCYEKQQSSTGCDATGATKAFAIEASGKVYKLDATGNQKAATALKSRADQAADPSKPQSTMVMAKVEGTESGGTITTQSIEVQ